MKPFQTFRIVTRKLCRTSVCTCLDRSRGIECQSKNLFDWSNKDRTPIETSRNSRIIFLIILINREKGSTNRKTWILNFHLENSWTWIFTLFILKINTLQPILVYPYIYNNISASPPAKNINFIRHMKLPQISPYLDTNWPRWTFTPIILSQNLLYDMLARFN